MSAHIARAQQLMAHRRFDLAEQELGRALAQSPDDGLSHGMLAICLSERKQHARAIAQARLAVHHEPDLPCAHYAHACVLNAAAKLSEAESALREALRLDPWDAHVCGMLGMILLRQSRWTEALEAADQGLAIDAEDTDCINVRAVALRQLGRRHEADVTIRGALQRSPSDSHSHANLGWTRLHQGRYREALDHFREALRLDAESEYARAGLVEALKARYFVYRIMLQYFLWMSRLSSGLQLVLVVGGYVLYRTLDSVATSHPGFAPWVSPFLMVYAVFALSTWLAPSFFDLMLRLSRYGRHALHPREKAASNVLLAMMAACAAFLAVGYTQERGAWLDAAGVLGLLAIPLIPTLKSGRGRLRRWSLLMFSGVAALGLWAVVASFLRDMRAASEAFDWFAYALLGQLLAINWLASRPAPEE